jgi:hypothetical protein
MNRERKSPSMRIIAGRGKDGKFILTRTCPGEVTLLRTVFIVVVGELIASYSNQPYPSPPAGMPEG